LKYATILKAHRSVWKSAVCLFIFCAKYEAAELTRGGKGGNIYLTEKGRNNKY